MSGQFLQTTLENGLRVCLERLDHVPSAACGFCVLTGARDESPQEEGVSHFLEHMSFKGTAHSSWEQINQRFDALGSKYNAFTSHERTMYYGWVPKENIESQIDLLAEMMRSVLPQQEFDTEKQVVLEEIAMYRDSLESCMFDLASKKLFAGSPLELSVLGTEETIGSLQREQMADYHRRRYGPDNMIFVASGNFDPERVLEHVRRLTEKWTSAQGGRKQAAPTMRKGVATEQNEKFKQQALMLCYPAPAAKADDLRVPVLMRALSGANSRIFWEVIQKGVCPDAGAFHLDYTDTGVYVLYALCEPKRTDSALEALKEQAAKLQAEGPTNFEVERVKNAVRTQVARDGDAPMRRLLQLAGDVEMYGSPRPLDDTLKRVEKLEVKDIQELLASFPIVGDHLLVSVGPDRWPTS